MSPCRGPSRWCRCSTAATGGSRARRRTRWPRATTRRRAARTTTITTGTIVRTAAIGTTTVRPTTTATVAATGSTDTRQSQHVEGNERGLPQSGALGFLRLRPSTASARRLSGTGPFLVHLARARQPERVRLSGRASLPSPKLLELGSGVEGNGGQHEAGEDVDDPVMPEIDGAQDQPHAERELDPEEPAQVLPCEE